MKLEDIKKVAVMGAGDMGHGIAELALLAGYTVALRDIEQRFVDKGIARIKESLEKMVQKQRVSEATMKDALGKIQPFVEIADAVKDVDFVIEAVPEVMNIKKQVFEEMDKAAPKHAVFASNTSNMSITDIAKTTSRPDKVVGMHFFNPAVLMKLVEVIRGDKTSDETVQLAYGVGTKMGKVAVIVKKDVPGFIYNRVNQPTLALFLAMVDRGMGTPEEIDAKMKTIGLPMGPFEIMDFAGLDVLHHGMLYFAEKLSPDYKSPPWLVKLVDAGTLGKKTGKGIYDWSAGRPTIDQAKAKKDFDPMDVVAIQVNEATKLLEQGVAESAEEIDRAMANGGGSPFGPFQLAKGVGFDKIAKRCEELAKQFGMEIFEPTKTLKEGKF